MSAGEIKAELASLGVSAAGCLEKSDLVERLRQAREAGTATPTLVLFGDIAGQ